MLLDNPPWKEGEEFKILQVQDVPTCNTPGLPNHSLATALNSNSQPHRNKLSVIF